MSTKTSSRSSDSRSVSLATDSFEQTAETHGAEPSLFSANALEANQTYQNLAKYARSVEQHHQHSHRFGNTHDRLSEIASSQLSSPPSASSKPWLASRNGVKALRADWLDAEADSHADFHIKSQTFRDQELDSLTTVLPMTAKEGYPSKTRSRKGRLSRGWPNVGLFDWLFVKPTAVNRIPSKQPVADQSGHTGHKTERSRPTETPLGISNIQYLVVGACALVICGLVLDVRRWIPQPAVSDLCLEMVRPDAILSRTHLAQLLAVSERTSKTAIQQVVAEPYCRLSKVSIRAGVTANREAYPLEFDPDTWLVMLYEGDEYAGFDFSFQK
ncbi:MAG: hypothetical protein F6K09_13130 [Merismopedia sp. SIO2A8]|nr:hypothetical protein [Merismopedia sp. SIO2A8]